MQNTGLSFILIFLGINCEILANQDPEEIKALAVLDAHMLRQETLYTLCRDQNKIEIEGVTDEDPEFPSGFTRTHFFNTKDGVFAYLNSLKASLTGLTPHSLIEKIDDILFQEK